jgi:hypothetical protein
MQVCKQPFGARLMSYVSKILAGLQIDVEQDVIPPPIYAIAFCMWECDQLVKRASSRSDELDAEASRRFTEIGYSSVFLGRLIEVKNCDRRTLDEKLAAGQVALKRKVMEFFRKGNWDSGNPGFDEIERKFQTLEPDEKKVYLWLEFLSFAHLMIEGDKQKSLACLGDDIQAEEAKKVFNEAYDAVRIKFQGVTMEEIREKYPDIYGHEEERLEKELVQTKLTQVQAQVDQTVEVYINMIKVAANDPALIQQLIGLIPLGLQERVCKELVKRGVVRGDIKRNLKVKIDKLEKGRVESSRSRALEILQQAHGHLQEARNVVPQIEKQFAELFQLLKADVNEVSVGYLRDMLEEMGRRESQIQESRRSLDVNLQTSWDVLKGEPWWHSLVKELEDLNAEALRELLDSPEPSDRKYEEMKELLWEDLQKASFMKRTVGPNVWRKAVITVMAEAYAGFPDMLQNLKGFEATLPKYNAKWDDILGAVERKRGECLSLLNSIISLASPTRSSRSGQSSGHGTPQRGQSAMSFGTPRGDA